MADDEIAPVSQNAAFAITLATVYSLMLDQSSRNKVLT